MHEALAPMTRGTTNSHLLPLELFYAPDLWKMMGERKSET